MKTLSAIFENGVFRPLDSVNLPDAARVELSIIETPEAPEQTMRGLDKAYAALAWRYQGEPDEAARVEELRR